MAAPAKPVNEPARLRSLRSHRVLDTAPEEVFDEISDLAAAVCETPMAVISFVDEERVWIKSKVGIQSTETPRDISFCSHGILQRRLFVVPDATRDERFRDNPQVIGDPRIRFYAGAQLVDDGGYVLGMLCVMDHKPRQLRHFQERALQVLARLVMTELRLRRAAEERQQLEIEAANVRLIRVMAFRLLHEIGNAIVPITTHQQLLADRFGDPEFRTSFDSALTDGIRRVSRLMSQMRFLAGESEASFEPVSVASIVEEAYNSAVKNQGGRSARLQFDGGTAPVVINGDVAGLTLAFSEIILNALQANPADPEVDVHCAVSTSNGSATELVIDFQDNGSGFPQSLAEKATQPFFSTRNVGTGLGLSVAKKVIEQHHGALEIRAPTAGDSGGVRVHLPLRSEFSDTPTSLSA